MTAQTYNLNDSIRAFFEYIGEDPDREGLKDTPLRVITSWNELYSGYRCSDLSELFKTFASPSARNKPAPMVLLKDIEFYSTCEHHLLQFSGSAHIAYIPNDRVVGISKLARLVEVFSRRLQIQERIGEQIVDAMMEHLNPVGAACVLEAKHSCMTCRGVNKQHSVMVTNHLRGAFIDLDEPALRNEFFSSIHGR